MIVAPRFQHFSSGGLALAVHGLFMLALVLSMSWKNLPQLPVEADLWAALPEPPPPMETPVLHIPKPVPPPAVAPQPSEADIALRKAEEKEKKRRAEEELRKREEARKLEEARQLEAKQQAEEKARVEEEERAEQQRLAKIKQELARQQVEQEMARQMQADLANEDAQVKAMQERALQTERMERVINDYKRRIQAKVQSYVRLPQRINGNPLAVFQVNLFANGEVRDVTLVKSSGQTAYDLEVERAILKASPLPLPNDKEAAAAFRSGLVLKFRPFEEGGRPGL